MTPRELLDWLTSEGVTVEAVGNTLHAWPPSLVTAAMQSALAWRRADVLALFDDAPARAGTEAPGQGSCATLTDASGANARAGAAPWLPPAARHPHVTRRCPGCLHFNRRYRTCMEPEAAGLFPPGHGFGIAFPPVLHAPTCAAWSQARP